MTNSTKRLLFISPIHPSPSGPGLAQRAYFTINALAQTHVVDLAIAPWYRQEMTSEIEFHLCWDQTFHVPVGRTRSLAAGLARKFFGILGKSYPPQLIPELAGISRKRKKRLAEIIAAGRYQRIHIFRLYVAPLVLPLTELDKTIFVELDLDDLELDFRLQLSAFHRERNHEKKSVQNASDARRYRTLEQEIIPLCDKVFVASNPDRTSLLKRFPESEASVLPNVVEPRFPRPERRPSVAKTLLFLGTLGYLPNLDGLTYFLNDVWPLVKASVPDCRLTVAGRGLPSELAGRLAGDPAIDYLGEVDSVDAAYANADAAIVPLRLGGGTRIKILEAFSLGCPVISTTLGAHGLTVDDGKHLLLGDSPELFADACHHVLTNPQLASTLSDNAIELVCERYAPARLFNILG